MSGLLVSVILSTAPSLKIEMLNKTSNMEFKKYLASKSQGWLWHWGRDEPATIPAASTSPGPGGAEAVLNSCAGSVTPATPASPAVLGVSDYKAAAELAGDQGES